MLESAPLLELDPLLELAPQEETNSKGVILSCNRHTSELVQFDRIDH